MRMRRGWCWNAEGFRRVVEDADPYGRGGFWRCGPGRQPLRPSVTPINDRRYGPPPLAQGRFLWTGFLLLYALFLPSAGPSQSLRDSSPHADARGEPRECRIGQGLSAGEPRGPAMEEIHFELRIPN